MSKSKRDEPREFKPFTEPLIRKLFSENKLCLTFLKEDPQFFFIDFPRQMYVLPVHIDEIEGIIATLQEIHKEARRIEGEEFLLAVLEKAKQVRKEREEAKRVRKEREEGDEDEEGEEGRITRPYS